MTSSSQSWRATRLRYAPKRPPNQLPGEGPWSDDLARIPRCSTFINAVESYPIPQPESHGARLSFKQLSRTAATLFVRGVRREVSCHNQLSSSTRTFTGFGPFRPGQFGYRRTEI